MIVARSYSPPASSGYLGEKSDLIRTSRKSSVRLQSRSPQRSTTSPKRTAAPASSTTRSSPVQIPSRSTKNAQPHNPTRSTLVAVKTGVPTDRQTHAYKPRRESAQEILSATAIPTRRKPRGRPSQRLPNTDHVAEFSKLLLEDVNSSQDGSFIRNQPSLQLDGLFGHIDELVEGQIFVGSDSIDDSAFSARSISSDSLASLSSPEDYSSSHSENRSISRSFQRRHIPKVSCSEDCSQDHPLAKIDDLASLSPSSLSSVSSEPSRTTSPSPRTSKKEASRSSFKSTLTSSLKAIKSAARTTLLSSSGFGHHGSAGGNLYTNESLLAHNFFDIQPSLTDDRRPPPTMNRPSPELRRYLNPQMASAPPDSPTQLHFWQDERDTFDAKREARVMKEKIKQRSKRRRSPAPKTKIDSLPPVVHLSTCLPPTVRTANASSPPIWLTPEGEPINKNTSSSITVDPENSSILVNGTPKNREPRENRDFLRMYVCEAAMRRSGKLNDDLSAGRARLWLPPLPGFQTTNTTASPRKQGAERWKSLSADDLQEEAT